MPTTLTRTYNGINMAYVQAGIRFYVWLNGLYVDENGQGLVEYLVMVLIILFVVISAVEYFFGEVSGAFRRAGGRLGRIGG
ncbi:MAG: hypothetical protein KKA73_13940 [Chloroflexi bacterium]|nr:hypothetical protein [Chloroflexota bacterium]MBU1748785.1 hypothetical protein [Chloroflexota bacterium]